MSKKARIAVLVSGGGTNLQALIDAEKSGVLTSGEIVLVVSNNPDAYALQRAAGAGIPSAVVTRKECGGKCCDTGDHRQRKQQPPHGMMFPFATRIGFGCDAVGRGGFYGIVFECKRLAATGASECLTARDFVDLIFLPAERTCGNKTHVALQKVSFFCRFCCAASDDYLLFTNYKFSGVSYT